MKLKQLRELAEQAIKSESISSDETYAFEDAANPQTILRLIDRIELLRLDLDRIRSLEFIEVAHDVATDALKQDDALDSEE